MKKRFVSVLLILVLLVGSSISAFAAVPEENTADPNGISWVFTTHDQRNGNYELSHVDRSNTSLPVAYKLLYVDLLVNLILPALKLPQLAEMAASEIITNLPTAYNDDTVLYYTKAVYEDKTMPGWYRKFVVQYYYDAAKTHPAGSVKIYYGYRA